MVTPQQIHDWLTAGMSCDVLKVDGDGQHFEALVVSKEFEGKMLVARHQRVYQALGDKMRAEIHALSMRTLTPEEWKAQHG
jgi:acid stress-induced BolA-like protein IbaG/YrbA